MTGAPTKGESWSHDLAPDAPHPLSAARRWTCRACDRAVVVYGVNVYGSATEFRCARRQEESQ